MTARRKLTPQRAKEIRGAARAVVVLAEGYPELKLKKNIPRLLDLAESVEEFIP